MTDRSDRTELNYLDGNAAAGLLSEVFAGDITSAVGRCASCGDEAVVAAARVYPNDHGLVIRCSVCGDVLLVAVEERERVCVDLRGLRWLEVRPAATA